MSDYIDRQELIENLKKFAPEHYTALIDDLIRKQPAADVRPAVCGKWGHGYYDWSGKFVMDCSACSWSNKELSDFCPNCGADMRG